MKEHLIVRELLILAAADLLNPGEKQRLQEHLLHCEACRSEQREWTGITRALKTIPIPQASERLVIQTRRLLYSAATAKKQQASRLGLALLVVFSWMVAFTTLKFVQMFDIPVARWLDVSSSTLWFTYIGVSWFVTALAAGILGKRHQQEGRTV